MGGPVALQERLLFLGGENRRGQLLYEGWTIPLHFFIVGAVFRPEEVLGGGPEMDWGQINCRGKRREGCLGSLTFRAGKTHLHMHACTEEKKY